MTRNMLARALYSARSIGKTVNWGVLSAGKITSDFVNAISITEGAKCVAVAAEDGKRAANFAASHNIPMSYDSYDELLTDTSVDVVYVATTTERHFAMTKKCILAGMPTVVEKPLTLTLKETTDLIDMAKDRDVFLMEGIWTRCFPAMHKVSDIIQSGVIGEVVNVQGDFGWKNDDCPFPEHRVWHPISGGMTYDIGMYMAHLGQVAYPGSEVENIQTMATMKNRVDQTILTNIMLSDKSKTRQTGMLQFYVTGSANTEERITFQGTGGRIVLDSPAHVPEKVRLFTDQGRGKTKEEVFDFPLPDDSWTTWNYPGSIGFIYEVKEVSKAIRKGEKECPYFTWNDSIQLAEMIEKMLKQARVA